MHNFMEYFMYYMIIFFIKHTHTKGGRFKILVISTWFQSSETLNFDIGDTHSLLVLEKIAELQIYPFLQVLYI